MNLADHFALAKEQLAEQGFAVVDNVLPNDLVVSLKQKAMAWYEQGLYRPARIGKLDEQQKRTDIRSDEICWIDDWREPELAALKELYDQLVIFARRGLYLPITHYEAHLAVYWPENFYLWHRDRHKRYPSRLISSVFYLNDLNSEDGGTLQIRPLGRKGIENIQPKSGRLVVFLSQLRHQVLATQKQRWSVTCWLRDDMPNSPIPIL